MAQYICTSKSDPINNTHDKNDHPKKIPKTANGSSGNNVLMWFRSDLRLKDNRALEEALKIIRLNKSTLFGCFLVSPQEWKEHDYSHWKVDFWLRNVQCIADEFTSLGLPFIVKTINSINDAPNTIMDICQEYNISKVCWNIEYEVNETKRDKKTEQLLKTIPIVVKSCHDQCIIPPGELYSNSDTPYTVFTPFKNKWYQKVYRSMDSSDHYLRESYSQPTNEDCEAAINQNVKNNYPDLFQVKLPTKLSTHSLTKEEYKYTLEHYPAGYESAWERLQKYGKGKLSNYKTDRDIPSLEGTTKLSMYLSLGVISVRQCVNWAKDHNHNGNLDSGNQGIVTWISEIIWREFYRHILFHFPRVCKNQPFKLSGQNIEWNEDEGNKKFQAWCEGKTGYPIVDAGMRQLNGIGWMHNRLRMIVSSFLVKDLLIDWRKGEKYFMNHLIDGDFASNNGGWQWSASTGTDSQPYFRIFNPLSQAERFDPDGEFIKKWIPELRNLQDKSLLDPYNNLDKIEFSKLNYPKPIVDHSKARKVTLAAFEKVMKRR